MTQGFKSIFLTYFIFCLFFSSNVNAQKSSLEEYNIVWTSQSKNAAASMPCGGRDVGLNVWVENGELLFYFSRSGTFDENNTLLKLGRVRVRFSPNPFEGSQFKQVLILKEGNIHITGTKGDLNAAIRVWVDVFRPVIHMEVKSNKPLVTQAAYESWRYKNRPTKGKENNANSYKWAPQGNVQTKKDEVSFSSNKVQFYHQNGSGPTVFDVTVRQQGLDSVKEELYNPLKDLIFGGMMEGSNLQEAGTEEGVYMDTDFKAWKLKSKQASKSSSLNIYLHTATTASLEDWQRGLKNTISQAKAKEKESYIQTVNWWQQFWNRSFIYIDPLNKSKDSLPWQVGRNYQLFRYMLGCNAYGSYPTKFNGGLFTYDPSLTDTTARFTPDFRNWGGGTHTAQNQRLVYFPMFRNGDFDLLKPQFDFYLRILKNAELRSAVYWQHGGACFTEQLENFGLPNPAEYNWKRPANFDNGVEYNAWLEYEWDTVLEFCYMMLETERYTGKSIKEYLPFIESCLTFFYEHYQYRAKQRGAKTFDGNGHLVLYPGSGAETYKMAYNATSTITALETVLKRVLELPEGYLTEEKRKHWQTVLSRIPPISFTQINGHPTIAPAKLWERINNTESPQLYPVYPWGKYGIRRPDLERAINTYYHDTSVVKFKSHIGWKQHNIFAARLGLTDEAARLTSLKLKNSERRFPTFWGPGFDWTPDHNWGGSGMIGLQEMLMQTDGEKIYLFPAWPKSWDVHFKLFAPYQTIVEAVLKNGKVQVVNVLPQSRRKDIVNLYQDTTTYRKKLYEKTKSLASVIDSHAYAG